MLALFFVFWKCAIGILKEDLRFGETGDGFLSRNRRPQIGQPITVVIKQKGLSFTFASSHNAPVQTKCKIANTSKQIIFFEAK